MHVTIVNLPVWDTSMPPLGVAYILAAIRNAGFQASVLDFNVTAWNVNRRQLVDSGLDFFANDQTQYYTDQALFREKVLPTLQPKIDELVSEICALRPDVLGFCVRFTSFPCLEIIANECRRRMPATKIVIGGPEASWANVNGLIHQAKAIPFEVAVLGEGEASFVEVLQRWREGYPLDGCKGIIHWRPDGIVVKEEPRE